MNFLLRLLFVLAGLVFFASLLLVGSLWLVLWALRAGWARLAGRPVAPFVVRVHPFGRWSANLRRAAPVAPARRGDGLVRGGPLADVTDVEIKP